MGYFFLIFKKVYFFSYLTILLSPSLKSLLLHVLCSHLYVLSTILMVPEVFIYFWYSILMMPVEGINTVYLVDFILHFQPEVGSALTDYIPTDKVIGVEENVGGFKKPEEINNNTDSLGRYAILSSILVLGILILTRS